MNILNNINHFVSLFVEVFRRFGQWRIWLMLLAYTLLLWFVLYVHDNFATAPFDGIMSAWLNLLDALPSWLHPPGANDFFVHFPGHYLALPVVFEKAELVLGLVIESLILGAVALQFQRAFRKDNALSAPRSLGIRWLNLALVWLAINALFLAVQGIGPGLLEGQLYGKRLLLYKWVALPGALSIVFGLLFFAIPLVAVYGDSAPKAIWRSVRLAARRPFSAFLLGVLILSLPILMAQINNPPDIVEKFRPELVYWLMVVGLFLEMIASFFWIGTAVKFLDDSAVQPSQ